MNSNPLSADELEPYVCPCRPGASVGGGVAVHAKLEGVGVGPSDGAAARAMPAGPSGVWYHCTSVTFKENEGTGRKQDS
eukprot:307907-Pelagomonas_calceolata.AAC.6